VPGAAGGAEAEDAPSSSAVEYGEGYPIPRRQGRLGSVVSSPAGSGAEPRPEMHFGVFRKPQNAPFCIYILKRLGGKAEVWRQLQLKNAVDPNSGMPTKRKEKRQVTAD